MKLDILGTMKTAYIFHDSFCDPFSEWYPWMKTTLESKGYVVFVPKFPSPAGQSYESWKVVIKNYINTFDNETILIGHGTGGLFALKLVQETLHPIQGLFLIASYAEPIGNIGYDRINKSFYEKPFDWSKIKKNVGTVRVFAGEGDPFVSESISNNLGKNLNEEVEIIPDGGHLGKAAGFTQLVPIAARIQESLSELDRSISIEDQGPENTPEMLQEIERFKKIKTETNTSTPSLSKEEPAKQTGHSSEELKTHTMYADMSRLVNSNQGRVASSLLTKARTDKAIEEATSIASGKNILYSILSLIIVAGAIGIGIFLYQKYAPTPIIPAIPEVPSLVKAEDHTKLTFNDEPSFTIVQKIHAALTKPLTDNTIRDIYYITPTGRSSFPTLLNAIGVSDLPAGLSGEFPESVATEPVFMHGLSVKNQVSSHFLVLKVLDYDLTFADMKKWEPTILRDLGPLMNISSDFLRTRLTRDVFQDELIDNKNVRTLRYHPPTPVSLDATGTALSASTVTAAMNNAFISHTTPYKNNDLMISYFFLNEKTLVITNSLDIVPELLKRWADSQIYQ
jgi:predicted alpha/beta hydrolase family esterase